MEQVLLGGAERKENEILNRRDAKVHNYLLICSDHCNISKVQPVIFCQKKIFIFYVFSILFFHILRVQYSFQVLCV